MYWCWWMHCHDACSSPQIQGYSPQQRPSQRSFFHGDLYNTNTPSKLGLVIGRLMIVKSTSTWWIAVLDTYGDLWALRAVEEDDDENLWSTWWLVHWPLEAGIHVSMDGSPVEKLGPMASGTRWDSIVLRLVLRDGTVSRRHLQA